MILEFVLGILIGVAVGFLVFYPLPLHQLERRRWKAIWANERWLKDLQDFIDEAHERIRKLEKLNAEDHEADHESLHQEIHAVDALVRRYHPDD